MAKTHHFTRNQEIANAISHGLGAVFSIIALIVLVVMASVHGNAWNVVSVTIYASTMLLLYVCSTLLHSLPPGRAKNVFEILDHASIYSFIAGTYTPILISVVRGWQGWTLLCVVWLIAAAGTVFKVFYVSEFLVLSTIAYILIGCMAFIVFGRLIQALPLPGILYLFGGGLFYIVGTIFYLWKKITYHHAIWHLFVLAGSICHFILILVYVLPQG